MRCVVLLLLFASIPAADQEARIRELERQVAELTAWRQAQENRGTIAAPRTTDTGVVTVAVTNKRLIPGDYTKGTSDSLFWDTRLSLTGRDKPVRAIKGELVFSDLFGEVHMRIGWTVNETLTKEQPLVERGKGIVFDQQNEAHVWLRAQRESDLKATLVVKSLLYQDGTVETFKE